MCSISLEIVWFGPETGPAGGQADLAWLQNCWRDWRKERVSRAELATSLPPPPLGTNPPAVSYHECLSKTGLAVRGACLPSTSRLFSLNSASSRRRYRLSLLSLSAGRFGWKEKYKI